MAERLERDRERPAGTRGGECRARRSQRKGLLFAGTEIGVFVSFDDGDNWQSLQMNLPVTSVRDLVIHEDDLVVGTHGRSFWILGRHHAAAAGEPEVPAEPKRILFAPEKAMRWRWNRNTDTPLPPEMPVGQNPPDGAIIDYSIQVEQRAGNVGNLRFERPASAPILERRQARDY